MIAAALFRCDIKGRQPGIITDAQNMNCCMDHRGGQGYGKTPDGAGILTGLPHAFLAAVAQEELGRPYRSPAPTAQGSCSAPGSSGAESPRSA